MPLSPQDSEDQTTPQAARKFYMPKQTSVESTNSYSENDDASEGQVSSVLKAIKEDPETTKKKEMHKNLMSEALKKVEMRNVQKKNFSQLARTNPTLAALNIVTRKELKMEEMQEKLEQEDINRSRNKSGSTTKDDQSNNSFVQAPGSNSAVNSGVLQTFRELSIHKGQGGQNSASRQAAIAAKKASTPAKASTPVRPDAVSKSSSISKDPVTSTSNSELNTADTSAPVVVLRKQPRILEPEELKARTSGSGPNGGGNANPGNDTAVSALPVKPTLNNVSSVQETKEKAEQIPIQSETTSPKFVPSSVKNTENHNLSNSSTSEKDADSIKRASEHAFSPERKPATNISTPSMSKEKDERAEKAFEKINVARELAKQQKIENQKSSMSVKQNLEGLVHVKPKQDTKEVEKVVVAEENAQKMVRRAAEKFEANLSEMNNKDFSTTLNFNTNVRGRSKSISNRLREQMVEGNNQDNKPAPKTSLPWSGKSPPAVIRKDNMRKNNGKYLLIEVS